MITVTFIALGALLAVFANHLGTVWFFLSLPVCFGLGWAGQALNELDKAQ